MAEHKVTLIDGLKVGDTVHTLAILQEPTVGDIMDAQTESERVVATPDGHELLASPTLVGMNVLRRQIAKIGDHAGPLSLNELRVLSPRDLRRLEQGAGELDTAALKEVAARGRSEPPSSGG